MNVDTDHLSLRLALDEVDRRAAERLRYDVFVAELGGDGPLVDHKGRFERDALDPVFDHLVLVDETRDRASLDHVIGVYRLLPDGRTERFYSEDEYDLAPLRRTGRRLLELGRSCVHRDYRGGMALPMLWAGLAEYVRKGRFEILFGVASLHGTDIEALAEPLSHLHHAHLAPPELRVRPVESHRQPMDLMPPEKIDRVRAMKAVPPLIKSYLRLGGFVGDGAFVDTPFNTTDVCLVMDTARLSESGKLRYGGGAA